MARTGTTIMWGVVIHILSLNLMIFSGGFSQDIVLNTPQILLPYVAKRSNPSTYILRAPKGCFQWTSTKPNVATVTPIDEKSNISNISEEIVCSSTALVTVTQKSPEEDTTVILAEEDGTGLFLRCDVFVDSISHIEIITTTRELLLGESPEVFEVHGYDAEGNIFTTLGSQSFEWSFEPVHKRKNQQQRKILRFLWFRESSYETSPEIYGLEKEGTRGSDILIEGINTGEAIITAKLSNSEYKDLKPSNVNVVVKDNILLTPPISYIMVHQRVTFKGCQFRRGNKKDIVLPSEQYSIGVINNTVVKLQSQDASVYGLKLGVTKVQLLDKTFITDMADSSTVKQPTAIVHVIKPEKIGFAINPGKFWVLQTQKIYEMHILLFDEDNNRILITDDTLFTSILSNEYFTIHKKSKNESYFHVTAKKAGRTVLSALLKKIIISGNKHINLKEIYGEKDIEIHESLVLTPSHIVFPWDPTLNTLHWYRHKFKGVGGSGNYLWHSENTSFCSVSNNGIVLTSNTIGVGEVVVSDVKNPTSFAKATVKVLPPEEMHIISRYLEVEVGSVLELPLSVSAFSDKKERIIFDDCRKMDLKVSFQDPSILSLKEKPEDKVITGENVCTTISLNGFRAGHTKVSVLYQYGDVILQDSIYIAVYHPVKIVDPHKFATIALGSTKTIVAEDGPLPWVLDASTHYALMSAEEEEWVRIVSKPNKEFKSSNNLHFFDVTCTALGEQLLTIEVGNKPMTSLPYPALSSAKTKFSCVSPATILLVPALELPFIDGVRKTIERCKDEYKRIPVRNERELEIELHVYDIHGNLFDDASSLIIEWSSDKHNVGKFIKQTQHKQRHWQKDGPKNSGSQIFNILSLSSQSNSLSLSATISKLYDGVKQIPVTPIIKAKLELMTFPVAQITPNDLNLYAHPSNLVDLDVLYGSGHFVLKSSDDSLAKIKFKVPSKINLTPKRHGLLTLNLYDTCLDVTQPSTVNVGLHDADGIILSVKDKVEVGKNIEANCIATSADKRELKVDTSSQLKLSLRSSLRIVDIQDKTSMNATQSGEKYFNVIGTNVGLTRLYCHARKLSGAELSSAHKEVQVFSAIELEPKYILLIVGSVFQIYRQGGPQPHSTTFTVENNTVAEVSASGLIAASVVGKTRIEGKAKGIENGKEIVYSSDEIIVEVIRLKGFKINIKSRNILSHSKIGILAVGVNNEGPFTFASSLPYLQFYWSSSNHKIATVDSVHAETGVSINTDRDFRAVLRTSSPGQVLIKLRVEILSDDFKQVMEQVQVEDEVQIQVYDQLRLLEPFSGKFLLPPNVNTRIKTNRDHVSRVSYELVSPCTKDFNHAISVSQNGLVTSHDIPGSVTVLVAVHENFGFNQTVLIDVEVKPVGSISLMSLSNFTVVNSPSFPIGSNTLFGVTLHDNVGRKFDVASIGLQHRLNRDGIVDILPNKDNATYIIRATNIGDVVFKIWKKENEAISDYVRIRVTEGVQSLQSSIPLGKLICFQSNVVTKDGWWSVSGKSLSIIAKTGVASAVAVGKTMVYYNDHDFSTYTEVTITAPKEEPSIIEDEDYLILTNAMPTKHFFINLHNSDTIQQQKCTRSVSKSDITIPFYCDVTWMENENVGVPLVLDEIFDVQSSYVNGRPACTFKTKVMPPERSKLVSLSDRIMALSVRLVDSISHNEYNSHRSTNIKFIPDFFVETTRLTLDRIYMSESVDIYHSSSQLDEIKVSTDSPLLRYDKIVTAEKTRQCYKIFLTEIPVSDVNVSVKIFSSLTKQLKQISVTVRGDGINQQQYRQKATMATTSSTRSLYKPNFFAFMLGDGSVFLTFTIMIATIVLILTLYHFYVRGEEEAPVIIHTPYIHSHSPPPYQQYSPHNYNHASPDHTTPGSYGPNKRTPTRLFSVSQ